MQGISPVYQGLKISALMGTPKRQRPRWPGGWLYSVRTNVLNVAVSHLSWQILKAKGLEIDFVCHKQGSGFRLHASPIDFS